MAETGDEKITKLSIDRDNDSRAESTGAVAEDVLASIFWSHFTALEPPFANPLSPELIPCAVAFEKNVNDIFGLITCPAKLLMVALTEHFRAADFIRALTVTKTWKATDYRTDPKVTARIDEQMAALWKGETVSKVVRAARGLLSNMFAQPDLSSTPRILKSSALSLAWTAFETLACDLWVATLNARPQQLGKQVLHILQSRHAEHPKPFSYAFLAANNFDLRATLGSALVDQFDFTSLTGIRSAFTAAFQQAPQLKALAREPMLKRLQAYRHSIVHRAGLADKKFIETAQIDVKENDPIPLADSDVLAMIMCARDSAQRLVAFVDAWMVSHPL